jgi:hypothetical protein
MQAFNKMAIITKKKRWLGLVPEMHESDDVDERDDDNDEDGERRHEVADENCCRYENAQRRQTEVAVKLFRYHLVRLPTWAQC